MKMTNSKNIFFVGVVFLLMLPAVPVRAEILEDFDKLGGNDVLAEKLDVLQPELRTKVVQERTVKRINRLEIAPEFTSVLGGDAYLNTAGVGAAMQFHFTPYVSLGARYNRFANNFSSEGENLIRDSEITGKNVVPDVDIPLSQSLAFVNFYPIYGKLNLWNRAVTQFDMYAQMSYGNIVLRSSTQKTWGGAAGLGFWFSQHLSTRFEIGYQTYDAQRLAGPQKMNLTVANLQVGYLL
jgi:outer membrane beta-barrel protein